VEKKYNDLFDQIKLDTSKAIEANDFHRLVNVWDEFMLEHSMIMRWVDLSEVFTWVYIAVAGTVSMMTNGSPSVDFVIGKIRTWFMKHGGHVGEEGTEEMNLIQGNDPKAASFWQSHIKPILLPLTHPLQASFNSLKKTPEYKHMEETKCVKTNEELAERVCKVQMALDDSNASFTVNMAIQIFGVYLGISLGALGKGLMILGDLIYKTFVDLREVALVLYAKGHGTVNVRQLLSIMMAQQGVWASTVSHLAHAGLNAGLMSIYSFGPLVALRSRLSTLMLPFTKQIVRLHQNMLVPDTMMGAIKHSFVKNILRVAHFRTNAEEVMALGLGKTIASPVIGVASHAALGTAIAAGGLKLDKSCLIDVHSVPECQGGAPKCVQHSFCHPPERTIAAPTKGV